MGKGNEEHQVDIPYDYWIARYPVTVAQFGLFIDDGGYEDPKWWTRAGWGWRLGELDNQVEEKRFKRWLERRPVENRTLPMWWEKQKQYLTRPVMGLSWFEAVAYAEWLQKRVLSDSIKIKVFTGEVVQDVDLQNGILNVRIPSEAEWEKATFYSKKQRYPWGNEDWDVERANVEKQISHPSPVGMYPKGTNAWSVHELAGNVWEWTRTAYSPYPYIDDKVKATSSIARDRVLRGGSWGSGRHDAHCTYRLRILPIGFSSDFGFRVIISLIASED
jgi:formylglycine-generating enzyme required for sulfatase activity